MKFEFRLATLMSKPREATVWSGFISSMFGIASLLKLAEDLDSNLSNSVVLTVLPGIICAGGVFFFHLGMVGSLMIYNLGLTTSISNALLPLVKHEINKRQSQRAVSELVPSQEMAGELVE